MAILPLYSIISMLCEDLYLEGDDATFLKRRTSHLEPYGILEYSLKELVSQGYLDYPLLFLVYYAKELH